MRMYKIRGEKTKGGHERWYAWERQGWWDFIVEAVAWAVMPFDQKQPSLWRSLECGIMGKPLPVGVAREDAEKACHAHAAKLDKIARDNADLEVVWDSGPVYFEIKGGMP